MKKVIPFNKTVHFKTMIAEITDIKIKHTLKATDNQTIEGEILVDGTYKMTEASQLEEEFHYELPFTIEVDEKYDIQNADINIHDFYFEIINEEDLKINVELEINKVEEKIEEKESEIESVEEVMAENSNQELLENRKKMKVESERNQSEIEILEENQSIEEESSFPPAIENAFNLSKEDFFEGEETKEDSKSETLVSESNEIETEKPKPTNVTSIFSSINQEETFVSYYVYIVREQDTIESILEKYNTTREEVSLYNDLSEVKTGSKIIIPCSNNE